ncbi:MAG TPA: CDC27 family protein [Thermoanaerobaculia bacterium]|nr:CDC27 family protein [Thermoanaerobaculia bacterium]
MRRDEVRAIAGRWVLLLMLPLAPAAQGEAGPAAYLEGLAAYRAGECVRAVGIFSRIVESDEKIPETLKARYFLVRCNMKLGRWREASEELIRIYAVSPGFYKEWNGDFLLGECRQALGED